MRLTSRLLLIFLWFTSTAITAFPLQNTDKPVVRAVLFYSTGCGHCFYVINEVMPTILNEYGDQLQVLVINVNTPEGSEIFKSTISFFGMESAGVPFLVISDQVLIGSVDIPEKFPALIDMYLAQGGVYLPPLPGLMDAPQIFLTLPTPTSPQTSEIPLGTETSPTAIRPEPTLLAPLIEAPTVTDRFMHDPIGNSFSVLVLFGMVLSFGIAIVRFKDSKKSIFNKIPYWVIPVLCFGGLFVSGYLAYVESNGLQAVCGPVGDCNTVQQSEYAQLFGFLSIGMLGVVGFLLIFIASIIQRNYRGKTSAYAGLVLLALTLFGALFSIYLTFLEPFVIGATCAWCLTSAIIMTLLLQLSLVPGKQSVSFLISGGN